MKTEPRKDSMSSSHTQPSAGADRQQQASHQFYGSNKTDNKFQGGHPHPSMIHGQGQQFANSPFPNMSGQRHPP